METFSVPQPKNLTLEVLERQEKIISKESEFDSLLADISLDRVSFSKDATLSLPATFSFKDVPKQCRENVFANIRLLHKFTGHRGSMLRKEIQKGGALGDCLSSLRRDSLEVRDFEALSTITTQPARILTEGNISPEALYERVILLRRFPDLSPEEFDTTLIEECRKLLKLPENKGKKWIDLISPVFNSHNPIEVFSIIFEGIGFLPRDITTRQAFKKVPVQNLMRAVEALRALERGKFGEQARYERTRLLNAMIAQGNLVDFKEKGGTITLDTNGVFINVGAIHSHIPYGLLEEGTLEALKRDGWVKDEEAVEATLRSFEENGHRSASVDLEEVQMDSFKGSVGLAGVSTEKIVSNILVSPNDFAKAVIKAGHVLPDVVAHKLAEKGEGGVSALMHFGEEVSESLTQKEVEEGEELSKASGAFNDYGLLSAPDEEYEMRARVLNDPLYYNAHKAFLFSLRNLPESDPAKEFIALRGSYRRARNGDQHSFLEVLNGRQISRILINEEKHLKNTDRKRFEELPVFDRESYQDLERVIHSYDFFRSQLELLEGFKKSPRQDWESYQAAAEAACYFLLAHSSQERYHRAEELFMEIIEKVQKGKEWDDTEFLATLAAADKEYRSMLYKSISNQTSFIENFMPEVVKNDVSLGETFAEEARHKTVSWGYDEALLESVSKQDTTTRIVRIDYKKNDRTTNVPYHIEEAALDALRIPRKRPLINVIGGARQMEQQGVDTLSLMSSQIVKVAHKHKMNVGVPGTQSGIGLTFGRENLRYLEATAHLPHLEKAHLFAISPGGNTYFPGNPYLNPTHKNQTYAITPVDSIITPFFVNWDAQGKDKRNSPYISHVEYMEALYARLARGQQKVTVVGNGGLYAIMEVTEACKRGFDFFLIEDSGRLAQVTSAILKDSYQDFSTAESCYRAVVQALDYLPQDVREEFIKKDFGKMPNPENEDVLIYREYFYKMLRTLREQKNTSRVKPILLADLEDGLEEYFNRSPYDI